jgi:uncharacterized protein YndB with AHSA1/START domain
MAKWNVPGDDWEIADYENDFRVGGREKSRFEPKGDPKYSSEGCYLDIVPEARIISAGSMHEKTRTSASLRTIEPRAVERGWSLPISPRFSTAAKCRPIASRAGGRYWTDWKP